MKSISNKIGKYFQLDIDYYFKNIGYLFIDKGIRIFCALSLSVIFARFLSKEIYGQYSFILAILGFVSVFTLTGINTAVTQAVANGYDRVLITGIKNKFKWSILGSIIVFAIGAYYFSVGSYLMGKAFIIASLFFPFFYNFRIFSDFLLGKKDFSKMLKYHAFINIISLIVMALTVYFVRDLIYILVAFLLINSLLWAYFFKLSLKRMENQNDNPESILFGKKLSFINMISTTVGQLDKIIIGSFLGFSDLAIYAIASVIPNTISSTGSSVAITAFPKLSTKNKESAYSSVKKKLFYLMIMAIIITTVIVLLAPFIIPFFYSEKYSESIFYAQLLSLGLVFTIPTQMISKALFPSQKEIKKITRLKVSSSVVEVILLFSFGLTMGLFGIVLAKLLGRIFAMIYSFKLAFLTKKI